MYGRTFTSQFGGKPDSTWVRCLRGITGDQIAKALEACLEKHPEWPPGAAQFRSLCLGKTKTLAEAQTGVIDAAARANEAERQRNRLRLRDENRKARTRAKADQTMADIYKKQCWIRKEDENQQQEAG